MTSVLPPDLAERFEVERAIRGGEGCTFIVRSAGGNERLVLKLLEISPVTDWSWWWILLPFGLAVAWWIYADSTGLTQRRAIRRMEERKTQRRERDIQALGLNIQSDRRKRAQNKAADEARQKLGERKDGGR